MQEMSVSQYRDLKMLSQSSLKLLDYNPRKFYQYQEKWLSGEGEQQEQTPNEAMKFGSLVDCKLLTPKDFDSQFIVNTAVQPTGQMLTFVVAYFALEQNFIDFHKREPSIAEVDTMFIQAYNTAEFKRDSKEKVMERFKVEGMDYYTFLKMSKGRMVVSSEQNQAAEAIIGQLKTDEFIGPILSPVEVLKEVKTQLPVFGELTVDFHEAGLKLKGLLDLVSIDHENKTIQPFDLKTTGEANFITSYNTRRYDIQGALYSYLLRFWQSENKMSDYQQLPFTFITVYTNGNSPELFEMSKAQIELGTNGGLNSYGWKVKGFVQICADYYWHRSNNKWNYSKEVYEYNGRKIIT